MFSFTGDTSGDARGGASFTAHDENGKFLFGSAQVPFGILSYGRDFSFLEPTTLSIHMSLSADATGHGSGFGLPNTSTASFHNSFNLIAITPRDAAGNFLPDVVITADSGFDYNPLIKVVPEPWTFALAALGLPGMMAYARRILRCSGGTRLRNNARYSGRRREGNATHREVAS